MLQDRVLRGAFGVTERKAASCREVLRRWRREWDSNPRYGFPYTRFPSVRLKPLGHPSRNAAPDAALGNIVGEGALATRARRSSRGEPACARMLSLRNAGTSAAAQP